MTSNPHSARGAPHGGRVAGSRARRSFVFHESLSRVPTPELRHLASMLAQDSRIPERSAAAGVLYPRVLAEIHRRERTPARNDPH
ncbi:hypothetical protein [Arthrobacter sp. 92]|jgi:hypothetical protein|uniref:hypothetical protein n=1 Tax=Arthrobacter sp. 92 TaxID=3418175 RepID=UPI003CFC715B